MFGVVFLSPDTGADSNVLRDEGDVWFVASMPDSASARLRSSVGLRLLARLVGSPGREWHVLELSRGGVVSGESPSAGLDARAKAAYRQRVTDLRAEIDQAEDFNDHERVERLREELTALTAEITRAVGLGGRDRDGSTAAERARVRVTRAVRSAISRVEEDLPLLGAHLRHTVRTGTFCCYQPDPAFAVAPWVIDVDGRGGGVAPLAAADRILAEASVEVTPSVFTLLFTDLENSTPRWELHPHEMAESVARHDHLIRRAVGYRGGRVFSTGGDGFAAVFPSPSAALDTALDIQRALRAEPWADGAELRTRIGIHSGVAEQRDGVFFGVEVNRTARVAAMAHGGQVVVTGAVAGLLADRRGRDIELVDLGQYRLKGLSQPEQVFQVIAPGLDPVVRYLRVRPVRDGNLPMPLTTFVGRDREVAELTEGVRRHRLITLLGPGGMGKTRLAIEAGSRSSDRFRDGVWLCELAPARSDDDVAFAIADALRLLPVDGLTKTELVVESLRGQDALLVIDNCEHVLDAAADLVAQLLRRCGTVTIIATSREPLGVQGERGWAVGGLDTGTDAPALFLDRALAVNYGHEIGPEGAEQVAAICRHLDGMPLAIELAAALTRSMTVAEIVGGLDDRFQLLQVPGRDRPGRHQTLSAALDWSYQLLSTSQRVLFDRLSVFPGSFDRDAAVEICGWEPLDRVTVHRSLHQLVEKSMVVADRTGPTTRFVLLETLRQFGAAHLATADVQPLDETFVRWYLGISRRARDQLTGSELAAGRDLFRAEWHSIRAAVPHAVATGDTASVHGLLKAVFWYAEAVGLVEVGAWAESAVGSLGADPLLLGMAGFFAGLRGDNVQAREFVEAALAMASAADDPDTGTSWHTLSMLHWFEGRPVEAFATLIPAAAIADREGDAYASAYHHAVAGGIAGWAGEVGGASHLEVATAKATSLASQMLAVWLELWRAGSALFESRLDVAFHGLQTAVDQAAAVESLMWESYALMGLIRVGTMLRRPDSDEICRDVLCRFYEAGQWNGVWGVIENLGVNWVNGDRLVEGCVLLGYLDAHDRHHHFFTADRAAAAVKIEASPDGAAWLAAGAGFDRDQLVTYALRRLADPG